MITITCEINPVGEKITPSIKMHNHPNVSSERFFILEVGDKQYTILKEDMLAAIENVTNTGY